MSVSLGTVPDTLAVHLVTGGDFIATLTNQGGDWATGAVVTLVFGDDAATTWTATIAGADATFNVDKAIADPIPHRTSAELRYTLGDVDQVWARGSVRRHD